VREKHGLSLEALGRRLGIGRSYLSLLENRKREKPSGLLVAMICQTYCVREGWLLRGEGKPFEIEYLNRAAAAGKISGRELPWPITIEERTKDLAENLAIYLMAANRNPAALAGALVDVLANPLALPSLTIEIARLISAQLQGALGCSSNTGTPETKTLKGVLTTVGAMALSYEKLLRDSLEQQNSSRKLLTDVTDFAKLPPVKSPMANLLDRLKEATSRRGMKTTLAKFMGVALANVSQWLSGEREPGGETTLRLLRWVEQQERQQNTLDSASNTAKGKTQVRKLPNEKQTQVLKKK
jgi:transcriptional regulator with XRE-family HTH domain